MKKNILILVFMILIVVAGVSAQTSWLDRPLTNWNNTNGIIPTAPRSTGETPTIARCSSGVRQPESIADRALTRVGWSLFGASQTYGAVTLINAMASVDGMCRPNQYNTFVFVSNRFAGTLSPNVMNSRSDGAISEARLNNLTNVSADFTRYTSGDAMCCPSQTSTVSYSINNSLLKADNVETSATCQQDTSGGDTNQQPETGIVRGSIKSLQRIVLPRNSNITVRLIQLSGQDANATTIVEQQVNSLGQQFPIPFELKFDPSQINTRRRYAVQAEISINGRITYVSDKNYEVLTRGNPSEVEITVIPGNTTGAPQNGNNSSVIRGNITYLQRIALAPNSTVTVRLVDVSLADAPSATIAEDTFDVSSRQVPIPFELRFNQNQIDSRQKYALQAEINTDGKRVFITDTVNSVLTLGSSTTNVTLTLVPAQTELIAITGQTLSLSKFGTGSFQMEGRNDTFIVRASANVRTDGSADVTVSGITGGIPFSGKLTYFDQNTLRITVESSSNANASGEIEIKYANRRINSITSNNLVLDNQKVNIKF